MPWVKSNLGWLALALGLHAQTVAAQGDLLGADEMAEAIVAMTTRVWTGPRTPAPTPTARPARASLVLRSHRAMVAVHADPEVSHERHARALAALEHARSQLEAWGWPRPISDGDLGGGSEMDLYLSSELPEGAYSDGLVPWTYLDRVTSFGVLSAATPTRLIEACVAEAYANALLLSVDPAEARTWRRATAAWLAWEITGRFGCYDSVHDQQAEPFRSWIGGAAGDGAGGALWLAYLATRHDGDGGAFNRDVWVLAMQRTWEGEDLRAEPDLWSATETAVERGGDRLLDNVQDLAVLRWFVGRHAPGAWPLGTIDDDARVPVSRRISRVPNKVSVHRPLEPFGSAYVTIDGSAWNDATELRVWLSGEYGTRWSLIAVALDARGREVSRIAAPDTGASPKAYVPVTLSPETATVVFVVTNLSNELPDADEPITLERSFSLTVDAAD